MHLHEQLELEIALSPSMQGCYGDWRYDVDGDVIVGRRFNRPTTSETLVLTEVVGRRERRKKLSTTGELYLKIRRGNIPDHRDDYEAKEWWFKWQPAPRRVRSKYVRKGKLLLVQSAIARGQPWQQTLQLM